MDTAYRPCVLAVFTNAEGRVLVAERNDVKGAWQFPQGGIDPGETPEVALYREMLEELGVAKFEILARSPRTIRYEFPSADASPLATKFRGQEQHWFLVRLAVGEKVDLKKATHDEFVATKWVTPEEAVEKIVAFKRDAYSRGLLALGLFKCRD